MKINFLSLEAINFSIAKKPVLRAATASIDQGQMVAIVGANGVGKTTLLKIICGILKPNSGHLQIDNKNFTKQKSALQLRRIIGYAPDAPPLYEQDTIENYLHFVSHLKKIPSKEIKDRINYCLDAFALADLRDQSIGALSKGMQQRINLAQAIIHQPQLLLLDEPMNGLDQEQSIAFVDLLKTLKHQGVTILFTSHHYSELLTATDYMLKIDRGELQKILLPVSNAKTKDKQTSEIYDHIYSQT